MSVIEVIMETYTTVTKQISVIEEKPEENLEDTELLPKEKEYNQINELYDECLTYLKHESVDESTDSIDPDYESIEEKYDVEDTDINHHDVEHHQDTDINHHDVDIEDETKNKIVYKIENELISNESIDTITSEPRSERLRKLSQQLPKIIITQSNTSLNIRRHDNVNIGNYGFKRNDVKNPEHKSLPKIDHKHYLKTDYEFKHNNVKKDGNKLDNVISGGNKNDNVITGRNKNNNGKTGKNKRLKNEKTAAIITESK